jgi:hypothetical protein
VGGGEVNIYDKGLLEKALTTKPLQPWPKEPPHCPTCSCGMEQDLDRLRLAEELLRVAPIHHYGKDYEQWIRQREAYFASSEKDQ